MKLAPAKYALVIAAVGCSAVFGAQALRGQTGGSAAVGDAAQQLTQVRTDLSAMETSRLRVTKMYRVAKKQKDIIKTSCIHEKLVRLKNIIALAREQFSRYLMERASGVASASVPLRQKIAMFKERADDTVNDAEQCAGEALAVTDKPLVKVTVDPKIPATDPTEEAGQIWLTARPPEASPYF